jgi:predicted Zn-dependent peptidase
MKFEKITLPNGLRIILVPNGGVESATTLVMVGAGSRYENEKNSGASHFLEHMAFKGTKSRPTAREISTLIDGIGAESNAFTGKEMTGYYIKSASEHVPLALDILSNMLTESLFKSEEIEREKGVIVEEINLYNDTPMRNIGNVYERLLYGDTPMGWDIAGKKETVTKFNRSDFIDYMNTLYSADNMVVVVAGNFGKEKILKEIKKRFSELKKFKTIKPAVAVDEQEKPLISLVKKTTDQAHFALGVRTVGLTNEKDRYPLSILASILGGGMSSRLFYEVRERRGLSYYVRTNADEYTDVGHLTTFVGADPKRLEEAIKVVLDEYRKISDHKEIDSEEVKKAKEYSKGHFVLSLEDSQTVAVLYAMQEILEKKIDNAEQIIEKIEKVTLDDIRRVSKKYLDTKNLSLAVIGNFEDKEKFEKLLK